MYIQEFSQESLRELYLPAKFSHKGQNGKLLIIGGSTLFHAASLWALTIASRIVDMVFYASVPENNAIVHEAKKEFRNGIVIRREEIENYIEEADCILIGPGMLRTRKEKMKGEKKLEEINQLKDEGMQAYFLTKYLLKKYWHKKWVIDAGALQMLEAKCLLGLHGNVIITPHLKEFEDLFHLPPTPENVHDMAITYASTILLKGETDIVCNKHTCLFVKGGNAGMTKGGTGDVLAGLVASLYCKNEAFLSATCASFFNKKAGENLFTSLGYYFHATDLALEIPKVMKHYLL
jgi:NAD(P)H-hydrate epimerase